MKQVSSIILMFFCLGASAQSGVKSLLDTVLVKARQSSLYTATTHWDSLQKEVYSKSINAKSVQDLKPALETLLNGLRDHHGKIIDAKTFGYIAWFTDHKNKRYTDKRIFDDATWKIVNDTALQFEYQLLPGKIGYLKIVGIGPNIDVEKESKKIRQAVTELYKNKAESWIIDLRYNTGGNMNPMMAGIAPLVGDGAVGSIVNLNKETLFDWKIKQSNFIYGGYQAVTLPQEPAFKQLPKVAVLTSRWTASSGEIVATAFKGRPGTRFFGEPTGGYTTNNGWEIINNEIILVISTGVFCDRNENVYETNIPVDVDMPFEITRDRERDACVRKAMQWLKAQ